MSILDNMQISCKEYSVLILPLILFVLWGCEQDELKPLAGQSFEILSISGSSYYFSSGNSITCTGGPTTSKMKIDCENNCFIQSVILEKGGTAIMVKQDTLTGEIFEESTFWERSKKRGDRYINVFWRLDFRCTEVYNLKISEGAGETQIWEGSFNDTIIRELPAFCGGKGQIIDNCSLKIVVQKIE